MNAICILITVFRHSYLVPADLWKVCFREGASRAVSVFYLLPEYLADSHISLVAILSQNVAH